MTTAASPALPRSMAERRPVPCPDVLTFPLDDELVLYHSAGEQAHILNATAAYVWRLCDGTHTMRAIVGSFAETYGLEERQALNDVCDLLSELQRDGLLASEP